MIETTTHSMSNLFAQLGLPNDPNSIEQFISTHRGLNTGVSLSEAAFWTPAQSAFLKEEILMDADWVAVIDELNTVLHADYKN